MANRRMFSKKITETDLFLDMPMSTQCLYFHLNMSADDDGFIGNAKTIRRMVGAAEDDLKLLLAKEFIIPFDNGIVVVKDWKIHNYIRSDRYSETVYKNEKRQLLTNENGQYERDLTFGLPDVIPDVIPKVDQMYPQGRLGKDRLGEVSKDTMSGKPDDTPYKEIVEFLNEQTGSHYRYTSKATKKHIKARFNEGFTLDDFKEAINNKANGWLHDDKMKKFLRPETLFGSKFEGYLNENTLKKHQNDLSDEEIDSLPF